MRLIFVGFGTVGQGLAELLVEKRHLLSEAYGMEPVVVGISDEMKGSAVNPAGLDLTEALELVKQEKLVCDMEVGAYQGNALDMIRDADADVMLEATYTNIKTGEPATSHIKAALEKGMHVVTTNKGPLALHYQDLIRIAEANGVRFLFEGTVMSGTPVLNLLREALAGSSITEIKGILNGTTNYILTRMEEGLSYEDALKKAQELGYAEVVPDADVLGWDALAKVTILAKVVYGSNANPFDYPCQGITEITASAIEEAKNRGKRFKLIGKVWSEGGIAKASVAPEEVDISHPLASVMGATNAITVTTDALGDVTIVGPGAGRKETGFSMLIDLIKIASLK
jgi:homoserine dehydrogenase